jgi:hypothetical protein
MGDNPARRRGGGLMPKSPIWLTDEEMEILRGYLGEILDNSNIPSTDIEALGSAYKQTLEEDN